MENYFVLNSLSDLGSWVSILGFIITCITAYFVVAIKNKFLFRANVDSNCLDLQGKAEELSSLLGDYANKTNEIHEHLARIDVILRALQKGASENFLKDIKKCRRCIKKYSMKKILFFLENKSKSEELVREIKTLLTVIVDESKFVKQALIIGK
ncbi:hypothetical protein M0O54_03335 [Acinetobacter lactucae]|uniref:Uncharacterized protein n=1 Tax=Acinetobacter lactucae TaxID=1785128 RepID=A0AB35JYG1_9GAMM|nr:hypothetical protein [Acinetobacter lactucae]MDD9319161.1 hypothetical protein [Acinetobacter lactucae]